jgi:hypothetical protein
MTDARTEVRAFYLEDQDLQLRYRNESSCLRIEVYARGNQFTGGMVVTESVGATWADIEDAVERGETGQQIFDAISIKQKIHAPDIYGPPHFSDFRSPSDA